MALAEFERTISAPKRRDSGVSATQLALVWIFVLAAMSATIETLIVDPFIRHDDYPLLLGHAERFYGKTLSEGRWLNYWWGLRPVFFDHQAAFLAFIGFWALTATLLSWAIFAGYGGLWKLAVGSLVIGFCSPMINIALWPGTLIPAIALAAGYAAVVAFGSLAARFWALPGFVVLTLMCHSSLPMLLFVMAVVAPGWGSGSAAIKRLIAFTALQGASLALAVAVIFTLNWSAHGVFGVQIADWRGVSPVRDLAGAVDLFQRFATLFVFHIESLFHVSPLIVGFVIGSALLLLALSDGNAALTVVFAFAVLIGVEFAQGALTGVLTPFRGQFPLWILIAAIPLLGLRNAGQRFALNFFFLLIAAAIARVGYHHWSLVEEQFAPYQIATRDLSEAVHATDPLGVGAIYVVGDPREIPGGDMTQSSLALRYRLEMLTDRKVVMCFREPEVCAPLEAHSGLPTYPDPGFIRALPGGDLLIRLPDTPEGKIEDPTQWLG